MSQDLMNLLENARNQQLKVKIKTFYSYPETGYIVDIGHDYLTLKKSRRKEGFQIIILVESIALIEILEK